MIRNIIVILLVASLQWIVQPYAHGAAIELSEPALPSDLITSAASIRSMLSTKFEQSHNADIYNPSIETPSLLVLELFPQRIGNKVSINDIYSKTEDDDIWLFPDADKLVIIGDTIELSNYFDFGRHYFDTIIIIARKFILNGNSQFWFEGPRARNGRNIMLIAIDGFSGSGKIQANLRGFGTYCSEDMSSLEKDIEELVRDGREEDKSAFVFHWGYMQTLNCNNSEDQAVYKSDDIEKGTDGGNLFIFAGATNKLDVEADVSGGVGRYPCQVFAKVIDSDECTWAFRFDEGEIAELGADGTVTITNDIADVQSRIPYELWLWKYKIMRDLELQIDDAIQAKAVPWLLDVFGAFTSLPSAKPPNKYRDANGAVIERLSDMRSKYLPALWSRSAQVEQAGLPPQPLLLLTESEGFETRLAPTTALVRSEEVGGMARLGPVAPVAGEPDLVSFTLTAKLTADPYLLDLVNQKLGERERALGTFAAWKLTPRMETITGVRTDLSKVEVNNNQLSATVVVRADAANLFLWKLGTPGGVRVDFDWIYPAPGEDIKGPGFSVAVSALRRDRVAVEARPGELVNHGPQRVRVSYVLDRDGHVTPLGPEFEVPAVGKAALPAALATANNLSVPPEAVEILADNPLAVGEEFQNVQGLDLYQKVRIANQLPAYDEERGGAQRFLELEVETRPTDSNGAWRSFGGFRLSPAGTDGASLDLSLLRSPTRPLKLRLSGTAHYENGSLSDIVPFETADATVSVTTDNLQGE